MRSRSRARGRVRLRAQRPAVANVRPGDGRSRADPDTSHRARRALGALAVAGVVIGFSLSSTLVKRAETPGVLVAFWRLTVATVVWNVYLWSTGRRVTMRACASGARARRVLRPEPRHLLRGGDEQQRRQRRADRLARAVLHRADRRQALRGVQRSAGRWSSLSSPSAASGSCCSAHRRRATRRSRATCSASSRCCSWWPTSCRRGTSAGTWTSPSSWRRSVRSPRSRSFRSR